MDFSGVEEESNVDKSLIIRFNKCVALDKLVILVVCEQEFEKRTIAKALVGVKKRYKIEVHVTRRLPLASKKLSVLNFDFIVFVMCEASRFSLNVIEEAIPYVDMRYFQGYCCFVAVTCSQLETRSTDLSEIDHLGKTYSTHVLYTALQGDDVKQLTKNILALAECASGLKGSVTPSFLEGCSGLYPLPSVTSKET